MNNFVSILLPAFKRPGLLQLGLSSILKFKPTVPYEIIVLNDGIEDDTKLVCDYFANQLNIKYIFTGHRNLDGNIKTRTPGFALNIGIKQAQGDIIILSCPEMYHLNNTIDIITYTLMNNPKSLVIPRSVYFDKLGKITQQLWANLNKDITIDTSLLTGGSYGRCHAEMPFLLAVMKEELVSIGGYNEKMVGYAGEDCELLFRLQLNGLTYERTGAEVIHLYHEGSTDGNCHFENPDWVVNWKILQETRENKLLIANEGKEWGVLEC